MKIVINDLGLNAADSKIKAAVMDNGFTINKLRNRTKHPNPSRTYSLVLQKTTGSSISMQKVTSTQRLPHPRPN
ncbi:hypothetical protein CEXT_365021 [Caerostris extrusa]|uniref:LAGLIDADG homing endonuclease n=1 Tax=Caerostris extrusa TaxID=172846 RepID=A0AAV4SXN5_CAEEX|nr:hypothetical protein CEXT_365021 [Caerostris extrusa]